MLNVAIDELAARAQRDLSADEGRFGVNQCHDVL
jgi:hypothetical protein